MESVWCFWRYVWWEGQEREEPDSMFSSARWLFYVLSLFSIIQNHPHTCLSWYNSSVSLPSSLEIFWHLAQFLFPFFYKWCIFPSPTRSHFLYLWFKFLPFFPSLLFIIQCLIIPKYVWISSIGTFLKSKTKILVLSLSICSPNSLIPSQQCFLRTLSTS